MKKAKHRIAATVPVRNDGSPHDHLELLDSDDSLNQHVRDDWVIVKKQRVMILVPALPNAPESILANCESSHLQPMPQKSASNLAPRPAEIVTTLPSVDKHVNTLSTGAENETQVARKPLPPQPIPALLRPLPASLVQRVESENAHGISKLPIFHGVSKTSRPMKWSRLPNGPIWPPNAGLSLNQVLRASNLEKKLRRAGGLSRWLTSLGLGQFVRIFKGNRLGKYQLVNLTMKKLKDMGANPVGPRRKLMHAIECLCQPHCFEAL